MTRHFALFFALFAGLAAASPVGGLPLQPTFTHLATVKVGQNTVCSLAFSPDGRYLAAGTGDYPGDKPSELVVWEVQTQKQVARRPANIGCVHDVAFSEDGRTLATGGPDSTVLLWDTASWTVRDRLRHWGWLLEKEREAATPPSEAEIFTSPPAATE